MAVCRLEVVAGRLDVPVGTGFSRENTLASIEASTLDPDDSTTFFPFLQEPSARVASASFVPLAA